MTVSVRSFAEVVAALLVRAGVASAPGSGDEWPVYVGSMPDAPDECLAVYDTGADTEGRLARGTRVVKPTVQVRVRGRDVGRASARALAVEAAMDAVSPRDAVFVQAGGIAVGVACVRVTVPAMFLKQQEKNRGQLFTVNLRVTPREI